MVLGTIAWGRCSDMLNLGIVKSQEYLQEKLTRIQEPLQEIPTSQPVNS